MSNNLTEILYNTKKAANIHKSVRKELQNFIKPGVKLVDICKLIENKIRLSSDDNEVNHGIAFPVGVSLNNIAAHWTPIKKSDETLLNQGDILKVDFGVHSNGYIVDSAFTWTDNLEYNPLLEASKDAVYNIIKNVGVDSTMSSLGEISEEIVKSYEVEKNGHFTPVVPIKNLCGHNIKPWTIHAGKFIPSVKNNDQTRVEENDVLAVEIFTSTGTGETELDTKSSHYMIKPEYSKSTKSNFNNLKFEKSKKLLSIIENKFNTLPFTQRQLDFHQSHIKHYGVYLNDLFQNHIINSYPALIDPKEDCMTAQFEHTICVSENNVINFSLGEDY